MGQLWAPTSVLKTRGRLQGAVSFIPSCAIFLYFDISNFLWLIVGKTKSQKILQIDMNISSKMREKLPWRMIGCLESPVGAALLTSFLRTSAPNRTLPSHSSETFGK